MLVGRRRPFYSLYLTTYPPLTGRGTAGLVWGYLLPAWSLAGVFGPSAAECARAALWVKKTGGAVLTGMAYGRRFAAVWATGIMSLAALFGVGLGAASLREYLAANDTPYRDVRRLFLFWGVCFSRRVRQAHPGNGRAGGFGGG